MARPLVRFLTSSRDGDFLAAAHFHHAVQIWDFRRKRRVAVLETVFESGGRRLAIAGDGGLCVAAGYDEAGLVAYRIGRALPGAQAPASRWGSDVARRKVPRRVRPAVVAIGARSDWLVASVAAACGMTAGRIR